ncbi:GNAT family N-acetyltransferase [Paenibacillus thermoaerophilus]|uniref:GNAT family N-acetyltransferase n=1 Tax=Paenibacillus thermoaerophilus TaxID=1215385 RepID=A0ABW2V2F1_9BACL|nr:GNAT family protein [Paenibacillus thermoaerophilus]TMV18823.1 GNAT family N-acetyltransferase [Paenibacillus thermoaerophilus]
MFSIQADEDIRLFLLEERHAEDVFRLTDKDRDYLREWLPWVDGTTSPDHTRQFIKAGLQAFARNNGFQLGISCRNQLAGCIGLHFIDWPNRKTSIGYWLGSDFQGRGIMTRACSALIDYLFRDLDLNRVEIRAAAQNAKSRAIPERLGFVNEGTVRQAEWLYDRFVDHVVYGLIRDDRR